VEKDGEYYTLPRSKHKKKRVKSGEYYWLPRSKIRVTFEYWEFLVLGVICERKKKKILYAKSFLLVIIVTAMGQVPSGIYQ
jgi:hypothetical protein